MLPALVGHRSGRSGVARLVVAVSLRTGPGPVPLARTPTGIKYGSLHLIPHSLPAITIALETGLARVRMTVIQGG